VRLFVRELAGVFDRAWPCSFQHPTLRDVAAWLTENSGITVTVPDAGYSSTAIPHFTHSGTGFQLLNSLGKAFAVRDYVWYQLPDGSIYAGGAESALFAGRPVDIPHEFSQGNAAGNSMTIPLIQSLRPGVEVNGQRLTKVTLTNDTMDIAWTPRNKITGEPLQKSPIQRQLESQFPELASGLHLPKMARVVAASEPVSSGNFADPFRPAMPLMCSCLTQTVTRTKQPRFIPLCRYRFLWPGMIRGCSSFRQKERWSKWVSQADARISRLYARHCRTGQACRT
jgi:hypothetical protein